MNLELKNILIEQNQEGLDEFAARYQPYDLAGMLADLEETEQTKLISMLSVPLSAEIIEYLEPDLQYHILSRIEEPLYSTLLNELSSDVVVDMLLAIHPHQVNKIMGYLPQDYREKINTLMTFPEDSAGSLATIDYIASRKTWTVDHALRHIRKVGLEAEIVSYIYVVDAHGELVGVVSLRELILAQPEQRLEELIKKDLISVPIEMHQKEVADILSKYDLVAIPVVGQNNRLIGVITVDDLIDVIHEEATEDFQKMGGSQPLSEPYFKNSIWNLFRKRIGWLLILFVAEAYTGTVLSHYEETLSVQIALAFFIPLLIGTGGNTGSQIVTTLVRALAVGEVKFQHLFRVLGKEALTGIILGLTLGIVAFVRAMFLGVDVAIGSVVAVTALFIVIWASVVAAILPLILHKLKIDPAIVSGPFITTLVDGTGLMIYFTMAKIMLNL